MKILTRTPIPSLRRSKSDRLLAAVEKCDLFLGILTPHYGSGQDKKKPDEPSITHQEVQLAIKLKKPRWLLAHDHVVFAWSLLKNIGHKGKADRQKLTAVFNSTPILDDLRVLDLYEEAIIDGIPLTDREIRRFRWGWSLSTRGACTSRAPDIAQAVNVRVEANEKALLESALKGIEPGFTEFSAPLAQLGKTVREEGSAT